MPFVAIKIGRRQGGVGEASLLCPLGKKQSGTLRLHRLAASPAAKGMLFSGTGHSQMKADAYADSSFIVCLLRIDANHEAAMRYMAQSGETLAFNPLQRVEVRNALRNAQALGQITERERRLAFRQIEQDLQAGLLIHTVVEGSTFQPGVTIFPGIPPAKDQYYCLRTRARVPTFQRLVHTPIRRHADALPENL